jgi:hypothetical protein
MTLPVYTDVRMKHPKFEQFNLEIFTREGGLVLFGEIESHHNWMVNFFMVFEEKVQGLININCDLSAEELFGLGPKLLMAAVGTLSADFYQKKSDEKEKDPSRKDKGKKIAKTKARKATDAADRAREEAMVTLVPSHQPHDKGRKAHRR